MERSRRALLWLTVVLLGGPAAHAGAYGTSSSAEAESGPSESSLKWLELTPLDGKDDSQVFLDEELEESVELEAGRWMLCVGGEAFAAHCAVTVSEGGSESPPDFGAGAELVGTIVVGGRAVSEVRISVVPANLGSRRPFTVPLTWDRGTEELIRNVDTDPGGSFRIPALAPGDYSLEVVPKGGRLLTAGPFSVPAPERLLARGEAPTEVQAVWDLGELRFDSGMSVEVLVTDTAGAPLSHARVGGRQGDPPEVVFFETEADEEGKAVLSGLDSTLPVHIVCVAEGHGRMSGTFEVPPSSTHCTMEALAGAYGLVVDESDEPVSGAVITLVDRDRSVPTDGEGIYHLDKLAAGTYELEVSAPGLRLETVEITLEPGDRIEVEPVVLFPGETILGEVVEATTGEPLPDASVAVVEPPGGGSTVTDEEGLFELQTDPERAPEVRIEAAGYPRHRRKIPKTAFESGERVRFEIRPGGRIEVRAWSEEGDGPCAACEFSLSGQGEDWPSLVTGPEGRALSDLLPEGRYAVQRVRVRSSGSVVRVSSGQDVRWANVVAGEIETVEFGEPTLSLEVRFRPPPPSDWTLSARGPGWNRQAEALEAGRFRLRRPPGDSVELILRGPEGATLHAGTLPAEFEGETFEADLPAGRVQGRLVHGEAPAQSVDLVVLDARQGMRRATARSNVDGSFAVPFLPSGTYHLAVGDQIVRTFSVTAGSDVVLDEILVDRAGD